MLIKSSSDTRNDSYAARAANRAEAKITSHDGLSESAEVVSRLLDLELGSVSSIFVDELHHFPDAEEFLSLCCADGKRVIATTLGADITGKMMPIVESLQTWPYATIEWFTANCDFCGARD
jgi:hypothetical protein